MSKGSRDGRVAVEGGPTHEQDEAPRPSARSRHSLDWLNFFIADVETGFGPFVAVYLIAHGWSQSGIGLLLTAGAITGIISQVPGGALVDHVHRKRLLIAAALAAIGAGALVLASFHSVPMMFSAEILHGATTGVANPAMAAIGLGLVGHRALSSRLGRNYRYKSFGNAATAAVMGALGYFVSMSATFLFAAALCLPAGYVLTRIRGDEIDYARARAARDRTQPRSAARLRDLAKNHLLLVFIASLLLFQLADASMVPLATERFGQQHQHESELFTSGLVVVPQVVTAAIALWIARRAEDWGRKPLLLAAFGVLPIRAILFIVEPSPLYLLAVQVLGGLTSAVVGILTPLVIADVTRGSGRYNLAQGIAGTAAGVGAAISTTASGVVAQSFGYTTGFLALAAMGGCGVALILLLLPETKPKEFGTTRWHGRG